MVKAKGTAVTRGEIDSFQSWKCQFDDARRIEADMMKSQSGSRLPLMPAAKKRLLVC